MHVSYLPSLVTPSFDAVSNAFARFLFVDTTTFHVPRSSFHATPSLVHYTKDHQRASSKVRTTSIIATPTLPFLPHEIMWNILSHLLVSTPDGYFEDPMNGTPSSWNAQDLDPNVLQTCSQIYGLGTHLLYSSNRVEFLSASALYRFTGGINQLVWNSHWITQLGLSIKVFEPSAIKEWEEWCFSGHLSQFYPSLKNLVIDLPDNEPGRKFMPIKATSYSEYGQICEVLAALVKAPVVRFLEPSYNEDGVDGRKLAKEMEEKMSTDIKALHAEYDKEKKAREAYCDKQEELR